MNSGLFSLSLEVSSAIISLSQVSKQYPGQSRGGVTGIDLTILEGEFVAIIGESGSGKSTLLKLIYGSLAPDEGTVHFRDERVLGPHEKLIPGHARMKMVSQDFNLNTYASVYDNIASMLSNDDLASKKEKTLEMMEFLRIEHLSHKRVVELSGGEQQRVAIARAIIVQPEVLLLDEPFSQIDTILKNELRRDLRRLSRFLGITIILVSHDPMDGLSLADRIVILKERRLVQTGTPAEVAGEPRTGYVGALLGDANILDAAAAAVILGTRLEDDQEAVVYPHQIDTTAGPVSGVVKRVSFRLFHDEVVIHAAGTDIIAHARPFSTETGAAITFSVKQFHIVRAEPEDQIRYSNRV
ncbi:MAG TPA: ABC transporter ATP-binding protein [Sphingobacteriaceae bacterium]